MSTLPDFTGPGFFAGEAPDGLTTIAGTPTSAQVRVYWRDPADPQAPDVLVASTQSAADGTWQIAGLNPALRYVVRAQKSQFDDVTVVGAAPSRSDVIAYVDRLEQSEEFDGLTGHVLLDSGLPPFNCEVIQPLPFGLAARVDGRKLLIEGRSDDEGRWESVVRVTASNGVWVDVPVRVLIIDGGAILGVLPGASCLETYSAQLSLHPLLAVSGVVVKWSIAAGRLPKGLHLDADTGVIEGVANDATGYYSVTICARTATGVIARRSFEIGVGTILCLLHFDGVNNSTSITDAVSRNWIAYGNAKLSTNAPRLGSACLTLDGNGDYVKGQDTNWSIGTGEFDFSAFCRVRRAGRVFSKFSGMASAKRFGFDVGAESTINMAYQPNSGAGPVFPKSPAGNAGAWNFLSVHRTAGGKIGAGTNGEYVESDMGFDADLSFAGDVAVGMFANAQSPWQLFFDGDVDELKLVAGARINVDGYIPSAPSDYPQPAPALAINGSLPPALAGQAYASTGDVQVHGSGAITVSVTDGALPAGWSVSVSGVSVTVSGSGVQAGDYSFVLSATDGFGIAKLPLRLVVL